MKNALHLAEPPQELVDKRRADRMNKIDDLPEDWRVLVHEYGFCVIDAMRCCGVAKARHARHLVETVLSELSPLRGSSSNQGIKVKFGDQLIWISREPTDAMIEASMETVATFDKKITKREKHRQRLLAALNVAAGRRR